MKTWIVVLIILSLSLIKIPQAFARDDWECWPTANIKKNINEKVSLKASFAGRFKDDMAKFYYGGAQLGVEFKVNKYFSVAPSYLFTKYKNSGYFEDEYRYILDAVFSCKVKRLKVDYRSRVEYRDLSALDCWRYRSRFKAGLPVKVYEYSLMPYISEEVFFNERKNEFDQNRFSLGVMVKITEVTSVDIYYILRSDKKGEDWSERNVLGISLNFSF